MQFRQVVVLLFIFLAPEVVLFAQEPAQPLPQVIQHDDPIFPAIARAAHVTGQVRVRITTDGKSVTQAVAESGPPLLHKAAEDNARTWKFVAHTPGTFEVTFDFEFFDDETSFLEDPGVVDIAVPPPPQEEKGDKPRSYTLPKSWDLELKAATNIKARVTMWTYGPWLQGYTGQLNDETLLEDPYIDGDMLGFEAVLADSHGQERDFTLIGKKTGEKIEGIFLDESGSTGTWKATPSNPPVSNCAAPSAAAEEKLIPVPEILQHREPEYPTLPWEERIQGQVRMRLVTDSFCVAKIITQTNEPLLAEAAEANVRTWRLSVHEPGTFQVTFNYRFQESKISFLEKPGVVEVSVVLANSLQGPESGLGNYGGYEKEVWKAQFASSRGHAQLMLRFPYGCCEEGKAIDTRGGSAEIKQGYRAGDDGDGEVGFSTTVRIGGRPTRISLIGRVQHWDKIEGIFLDESGNAGTWSAKLISHGSLVTYE
jgi:outer membrane biosynthesis protein TonB